MYEPAGIKNLMSLRENYSSSSNLQSELESFGLRHDQIFQRMQSQSSELKQQIEDKIKETQKFIEESKVVESDKINNQQQDLKEEEEEDNDFDQKIKSKMEEFQKAKDAFQMPQINYLDTSDKKIDLKINEKLQHQQNKLQYMQQLQQQNLQKYGLIEQEEIPKKEIITDQKQQNNNEDQNNFKTEKISQDFNDLQAELDELENELDGISKSIKKTDWDL